MCPGGVVQGVRVLKEGRRDEVVFDFKDTLSRRPEHVLGVCCFFFFFYPPGRYIKVQSWTVLKSFNSLLL